MTRLERCAECGGRLDTDDVLCSACRAKTRISLAVGVGRLLGKPAAAIVEEVGVISQAYLAEQLVDDEADL